jgi:hypothetical protein
MSMCPNSCRMIFHFLKTLSRIFSRVFKNLKLITASCWTQLKQRPKNSTWFPKNNLSTKFSNCMIQFKSDTG